uniref:gp16 family protein n=1 Tax=Serratia marcescens TaxID=615 RepID=UPI001BCED5F1|nr:regulatory protein GemA [Serratia marcescens]
MNKPQLIRLIHVAKGKLNIPDDAYRALLAHTANGKTSCSQMNIMELSDVYAALQDKGFKRSFKPAAKRVRENAKGAPRVEEISKIRAIWGAMHRHGFIDSGEEVALNKYVKRMSSQINDGVGVDEVGWLNGYLAFRVLECLKQWHIRLMLVTLDARKRPRPVNPQTGEEARSYDLILAAFEEAL